MSPESYGPAYEKGRDQKRIHRQMDTVRDYMLTVGHKTLAEIEGATRFPQASISAQLRHLRKKENGWFDVDKRHRGEGATWEYRVRPRETKQPDLPYENAPVAAGASA